ncbi:phospholipase A1 PLIP2, chloroplastic-like isoform X2 [Wolffia australiana]
MEGLLFRPPMAVLGFTTPPASIDARSPLPATHVTAAMGKNAAAAAAMAAETTAAPAKSRQSYMIFHPLKRIWPAEGGREEETRSEILPALAEEEEADKEPKRDQTEEDRENWVMKILRVRSVLPADDRRPRARITVERPSDGAELLDDGDRCVACGDSDDSDVCFVGEEEDEEETKFDRESFSKLLRRVPLSELRLFLKLSDIGSIAYVISKLNPADLLRERGMTLVASSADGSSKPAEPVPAEEREKAERREQRKTSPMRAASAYQIAASAASYLQSWSILPFKSRKDDEAEDDESVIRPELNSFMATTDSVTAVVAAKEETKQAVAEDLNSVKSSPCEWFICDEDASRTRFFVIQGSESLASWQANLLFEPVPFEGLDVLVHRGIYEAAKGIYQRMLPHVREHIKALGGGAAFRFTGHSLGGSLSLLISLMLLLRGELPASSLLPVVTFGAPSIMCGGDGLLRRLGLPTRHVQAITMHRDIVPRAFSCNYPDHVAEILKALNSNFRRHPCLKHQHYCRNCCTRRWGSC